MEENRINSDDLDYTKNTVETELQFEDSLSPSANIEKSDGDDIYPMKSITIEKAYYTVFELKRKYEQNRVILDSDFQRKSVWSINQKRELIESILMGLPLPVFYFNVDKKGRLIVIDGRQRLTALFEFLSADKSRSNDTGFSLGKLSILKDLNNKKFRDLEPIYQSKLEDYQVMAHEIKPPTPERIMYDIFDRVNRAGTPLNKQEIRNALYQGHSTRILEEICESNDFEKTTEKAFVKDKRMKDRYITLRFLAFYLYFNKEKLLKNEKKQDIAAYKYLGDIDEFVSLTMEYINDLSELEANSLRDAVLETLIKAAFYLGENAFRLTSYDEKNYKLKKYPTNINLFEMFMLAMSFLPFNDYRIKDEIRKKFNMLKDNGDFKESLNNHRDSEAKVKFRYDKIMEIVGEYID